MTFVAVSIFLLAVAAFFYVVWMSVGQAVG